MAIPVLEWYVEPPYQLAWINDFELYTMRPIVQTGEKMYSTALLWELKLGRVIDASHELIGVYASVDIAREEARAHVGDS
jgi:hypothetical protein